MRERECAPNRAREVGKPYTLRSLGLVAACGFALLTATVALADPLTVLPSVTLSEEYTDNVFFQVNPQSDFITRLQLGLGVTYNTPRSQTTLSTATSAVYFAKRPSESQISLANAQQLSLTSTYAAAPQLSLAVNNGFVRSKNSNDLAFILSPGGISAPPPEPDPSQGNPGNAAVVLPRGSALNNSFGASAAYTFEPSWITTVAYTNGYGSYTNPDSQNLTQRGLLTLTHPWSPSLSFNGNYSYSRFNSTNAADSESNAFYVGASYQYSEKWSGTASAGASFNDSIEAGGAPTGVNAIYNLAVTRLLQERWGVTAGVSQNMTPSVGVAGASVTLNTYLSSWATLAKNLTGTVYVSYSNFNTSGPDFYLFSTQIGLYYPVWRRVTAGLIYGFRQTDSVPGVTLTSGQTINANSVQIRLSTVWPFQFDL